MFQQILCFCGNRLKQFRIFLCNKTAVLLLHLQTSRYHPLLWNIKSNTIKMNLYNNKSSLLRSNKNCDCCSNIKMAIVWYLFKYKFKTCAFLKPLWWLKRGKFPLLIFTKGSFKGCKGCRKKCIKNVWHLDKIFVSHEQIQKGDSVFSNKAAQYNHITV